MLVTDYDILIRSDVNGYAKELTKAYHETDVVWEPKKNLVPVSALTLDAGAYYVLYNPELNACFSAFGVDTVSGVSGPSVYSQSGVTTQLDKMMLFQYTNSKLKAVGYDLYLADGGAQSPDTNRTVVLDATGVTITFDNQSTAEVFPCNGNFRLGFTVTGSAGNYTLFDPMWYNHSMACDPDKYLLLYKVENI